MPPQTYGSMRRTTVSQRVQAHRRVQTLPLARDGTEASLIDARLGRRSRVPDVLESVLSMCVPHAEDLGCSEELQWTRNLAATPRSVRQLDLARGPDKLHGLVEALSALF